VPSRLTQNTGTATPVDMSSYCPYE
jgi:hypothetical protein